MTQRNTEVVAEPGSYEIVIVREFDAACNLVFRTHVEPDLFARWYGCNQMTLRVERFDARTGGSYRYFKKVGEDPETPCRGVFHEVTPGARIVLTFEPEDRPGHVVLETVSFVATLQGRTKVARQMLFQSVADRDAMVEYGVAKGMSEAFLKLDQLLELHGGASR